MKNCFIESFELFEHYKREGYPEAADLSDEAYILCMKEEKKAPCNYPIMRHLLEQTEAFKKGLSELEMLESEEQ